jgi:dethiobiotin synthetase
MGQGILITGTDTGAGKTVVTCLLGKRLLREKIAVLPLKPVESGCAPGADERPFPVDAAALRDAFAPGLSLSEVCLYPLSAVLSPHLAARAEGVSIDSARIRQTVIDTIESTDIVLIEGAGGVTVEIREGYSFADLARDLSLPVLIVAGNRLGVLNHLQLTMHYLQSEKIPLFGVILNDLAPEPFAAREPNETEVRRIAGGLYLGRIPCGAAALPEEVFSRFLCRLLPPPLNPLQPGEEKGRIPSRRGREKAESPPAGGGKIR